MKIIECSIEEFKELIKIPDARTSFESKCKRISDHELAFILACTKYSNDKSKLAEIIKTYKDSFSTSQLEMIQNYLEINSL